MIYKCNNCGRMYNLKPDFCDCGNNELSEVVENFDYSTVKTDYNLGQDVDFLYNQNDSFRTVQEDKDADFYEKDLNKQRISEVIAIVVFVIVLISALIMIFLNVSAFFKQQKEKTASVAIESYIPSDVNEFWTDKKSVNTSTQSLIGFERTNSVTTDGVKKSAVLSKGINSQQLPKIIQNSNKILQEKKTSDVSVIPKNHVKTTLDKKNTQIVAKSNPNISTFDGKAEKNAEIKEILIYKNELRNRLFSNFPILTVQGSGSAKVAFSVSSEGKLINRHFVSQSGNKSLDDAMYHMLMRVPIYTPPPNGFEEHEIVMQMDFNNGHYAFSFVN